MLLLPPFTDLIWQRWPAACKNLEIAFLTTLRKERHSVKRGLRSLSGNYSLCAPFPRTLDSAPVLSPLIYKLGDSRCSGQNKQRGSWREGGLPAPVCYYLAPRCTKKKKKKKTSVQECLLVCRTCLAWPSQPGPKVIRLQMFCSQGVSRTENETPLGWFLVQSGR